MILMSPRQQKKAPSNIFCALGGIGQPLGLLMKVTSQVSQLMGPVGILNKAKTHAMDKGHEIPVKQSRLLLHLIAKLMAADESLCQCGIPL